MRLCERNLSTFYYCMHTGKTEITIGSGQSAEGTGEFKDTYGNAVACVGHIGGNSGRSVNNPFGIMDEYERTIIVADNNCPIKSDTVLFLDKQPEYEVDGTPKFDYTVVRVGQNLGYFYILVKKV